MVSMRKLAHHNTADDPVAISSFDGSDLDGREI
jgi:hypothetical protein